MILINPKTTIAFAFWVFYSIAIYAQAPSNNYLELVRQADSLFNAKMYAESAKTYSAAFESLNWKGMPNDRYNAARSWAQTNNPDSAFFQLNRLATRVTYSDYNRLVKDVDLASLHTDSRWKKLLVLVKKNKKTVEKRQNNPIAKKLSAILDEDQKYRLQIDSIEERFGRKSKEITEHWKLIEHKDSLNLLEVKKILDKHGWLGPDEVGSASSALFLVIQHSDLSVQETYLPMMRQAVKEKKASPSNLAMLEDRVAIGQGKYQVYGSQIGIDTTGKHYLIPVEDPDHINQRRASVGLGTIESYIEHWDMKWDVEQYKRDLPMLEGIWRKQNEKK